MSVPELHVKRLSSDAQLPVRAHEHDAGLDLFAAESLTIEPGERALVRTGIAIEFPAGWTALVCARSGLASRHGISLVNAPGVIDAGYRGEVKVILLNNDRTDPFTVNSGERIAQLLLVPVALPKVVEQDELSASVRNDAGFGSSGTRELATSSPAMAQWHGQPIHEAGSA